MNERMMSCSEAFAEAMAEEMERDESIFVIGEDIRAHDGIFGQFQGLPKRFPEQITASNSRLGP